MIKQAFRQFQHPTVPLRVSSEFRVKTLRSALDATVTAAMGKHPAAGPGEPRQAAPGSRQTVGEQAREAR